ncbi:MAG: succinate dehydrogenase, cytochrome b556 subunit [Chloroflexota bacterium]|nr:succinate dehydrogenase, cytochrome b556 subunit [Chloroflexota bacterium]
MYRGREGMWSWIFHRVSGIGVLLFLFIHIVDTALIGWGPDVYNAVTRIYHEWTIFRFLQFALIAAVLYHSFNGVRVIVIDFWPKGYQYQRQLFYGAMGLTILALIPTGYFLLGPVFGLPVRQG